MQRKRLKRLEAPAQAKQKLEDSGGTDKPEDPQERAPRTTSKKKRAAEPCSGEKEESHEAESRFDDPPEKSRRKRAEQVAQHEAPSEVAKEKRNTQNIEGDTLAVFEEGRKKTKKKKTMDADAPGDQS